MSLDPRHTAVLGLHWQLNVVSADGFFASMLAEPVARSGVVDRARRFHEAAHARGAQQVFTRFTIPDGEGRLVRNTGFMRAVADAQESFRPHSSGAQLVPEMAGLAEAGIVADNQRLSGLAAVDLPDRLRSREIDTLLITGVATNLTVEQTARHGADLGFTVHVVGDCVTAATEQAHTASLANLDLTTAGVVTAEQALDQLGT